MGMLWERCACAQPVYARLHRKPWMKLFGSRRLYECDACGKHQFIARISEAHESGDRFRAPLIRDQRPST